MRAILIADDGHLSMAATAARRLGAGLELRQFYDPVVAADPVAIAEADRTVAGLRPLGVHGPLAELSPGSFDTMIREATRHRFELGCAVAERLDAHHLILHHGYVPGASLPPADWLRRCAAFWREFLDASPTAIQFHIENVFDRQLELLRDVIDAVAAPNLSACLDIGHAHCFSRTAVTKWAGILGSRIGCVHVHSSHGEFDEHLAPYDGSLDVAEVLRAVGQSSGNAIWTLEVPLTTIDRSMEWLRALADRT